MKILYIKQYTIKKKQKVKCLCLRSNGILIGWRAFYTYSSAFNFDLMCMLESRHSMAKIPSVIQRKIFLLSGSNRCLVPK